MNSLTKINSRMMIVKRIRKYALRIDILNIKLAFEEAQGYHIDSLSSLIKQEQMKLEKALLQRTIKRLFNIYIKYL